MMAACKDCIHNEMCFGTHTDDSPTCCDFKDKSRYIELPCKVGDIVYWLDTFIDDETCAGCENYYDGGMGAYSLCKKTCDVSRCTECIEIVERVASKDFILRYFNDFGKTVFLTREEAEKALKERT